MTETITYFKQTNMLDQPEAFSRVLIDRALEDSGWNLLDKKQVRFEIRGDSGRADYVLITRDGGLNIYYPAPFFLLFFLSLNIPKD